MKLFAALAMLFTSAAFAQVPATPAAQLRTQTTVVLVPTLVRNAKGEPVYTLKADDFTLTDDGIPQTLTLEQESGGEPLALVVVIEVGGAGARQFSQYNSIAPPLAPMLESIVGNVPHKVAVVTFDSEPSLLQNFTSSIDVAADAIRGLQPGCTRQHHMENCAAPASVHDVALGDNGAAILDALGYSVDLLRGQPQKYRRAILMISETLDRGSHITLDRALRAVTDTNTVIYTIAFSTGKSEAAHYAARELPTQPAGLGLENPHPNPPHGCMGKDPNPDPDATTNKAVQAYDCLTQLIPPLALAKAAAIEATDGLKQNIPETVARLTGGEYYKLTDAKSLERDLAAISNHVPNRYMLSFHPVAPHAGFHSIQLRLKDYPALRVTARSSYWAASEDSPTTHP
jgi:VWFA-related protein